MTQNHPWPHWEVPPVTPSDFPPLLTSTECVEHHIRVIWVFDESWLGWRFCTCHSYTNSHTLTHGMMKYTPSITTIKTFVTTIKALFSDPHQSHPQSPHITSDPFFLFISMSKQSNTLSEASEVMREYNRVDRGHKQHFWWKGQKMTPIRPKKQWHQLNPISRWPQKDPMKTLCKHYLRL